MRDLEEDLRMIEAYIDGKTLSEGTRFLFTFYAARDWSIAIHRALEAEARVKELEEAVRKILDVQARFVSGTGGQMHAVPVASMFELNDVYRKGLKPDGTTA